MRYFGVGVFAIVGLLFVILASSVAKGNIDLIHSYHTKNVKDGEKKSYLKLFSLGLNVMGISFFISSIFTYFGMAIPALISTFLGIIIGIILIVKAQKNTMVEFSHEITILSRHKRL